MSKTQIVFILDRSGSMQMASADAVGGFNAFMQEHRRIPKGKRFTVIQFDHEIQLLSNKSKIKYIPDLVNGFTYKPRGNTALLDAIGFGIDVVEGAEKAILVIYTDGMENCSQNYTASTIKTKLDGVRAKGWEVLFLASGIKATEYATQFLNIPTWKTAVAGAFGTASLYNETQAYTVSGSSGLRSSNGVSLQSIVDSKGTVV